VTLESPKQRKKNSEEKSEDIHPPDFENFWNAYPLHKAKAAAEKTFQKIIYAKIATPDELIEGAIRYAAERLGKDHQYTKHAATWLNAGCWNDEPAAAGASQGGSLASALRGLATIPDEETS
jgi:hypothetical protein